MARISGHRRHLLDRRRYVKPLGQTATALAIAIVIGLFALAIAFGFAPKAAGLVGLAIGYTGGALATVARALDRITNPSGRDNGLLDELRHRNRTRRA